MESANDHNFCHQESSVMWLAQSQISLIFKICFTNQEKHISLPQVKYLHTV